MAAIKLDGVDRYNPENIASLEAGVDAQCRDGTYDVNANLAVLKLYDDDDADHGFSRANTGTSSTRAILTRRCARVFC